MEYTCYTRDVGLGCITLEGILFLLVVALLFWLIASNIKIPFD